MELILINILKNNSVSEEFPTGQLTERFVTKSQLDKIIETFGEDLYTISEKDVDNIINNYP